MYAVILGQIIAVTEETNWQARTIHGGRSAEVIRCWRVVNLKRGRLPEAPSLPENSISSSAIASGIRQRSMRSQNCRDDRTRPRGRGGQIGANLRLRASYCCS